MPVCDVTPEIAIAICLVRGFTGRAFRTIDLQPAERMAA
jgi:hypothetical protein